MSDFTETPGGGIRQGSATVQESAGCSSAVARYESESSDDRIIADARPPPAAVTGSERSPLVERPPEGCLR